MVRRPIGTHAVKINRGAAIHAGEQLDEIDAVLGECAVAPSEIKIPEDDSITGTAEVREPQEDVANPMYDLGRKAVEDAMNDPNARGVAQ